MKNRIGNKLKAGLLVGVFALQASFVSAQDDIVSFDAQYAIGSLQSDYGSAIAHDADGNIYIYGEFGDDMDCDPTDGEFSIDPQGQPDLFLGKYNNQGEVIWAFGLGRIALNDGVIAGDLQVDSDGNVYIVGSFSSFVDFDPSDEQEILTSMGGHDAFVAKYNSDGELVWVNQYGTPSTELSKSSALDGDENLTFSLRFSEPIDLQLGEGVDILTPIGGADVAAVKVGNDGSHIWSHQISSDETDEISALRYASNGVLAIGASIHGVSNPFPVSENYLAVIGADGNLAWDYSFDNLDQNNEISAFAFDAGNTNIYVGGRIQGTTDFDPSGNESIIDPLFADPFFSKYNLGNGDLVWAKFIECDGIEDYVSGMTEAGSVLYVAGSFDITAKFDPEDFSTQISSEGGMDIYLAAYDNMSGEFVDAVTAGGPGSEHSIDADFDLNGLIYTTGKFSTSIKLNPDTEAINSFGFSDIFFATFNYETALSLGDKEIADAFSVYPVPASDVLNISWVDYGFAGDVGIKATNVVGQTVKEFIAKTVSGGVKMDVSDLKSGVYILTFESDGFVFSKRFVKQ